MIPLSSFLSVQVDRFFDILRIEHRRLLHPIWEEGELMRTEYIRQEAARVKRECLSADPQRVCDALRIRVSRAPMGTGSGACKGFFLVNARCRLIMLNSDLAEEIQRIILAHELGHAVLHSSAAIRTFHEFSVLSEADRLEYEANVFAADFLLEDADVLEALDEQQTLFRAASRLQVPPELLDLKARLMERSGCPIRAPWIARGDFLRRDIRKPLDA